MSDRHFDQLATRFAEKIYGGAKGAIRLAVLQADLEESLPKRPLRVLDIGAGLGHKDMWPRPAPISSTRKGRLGKASCRSAWSTARRMAPLAPP